MSSAKIPRQRAAPPDADLSQAQAWLRTLMVGYYPFVGLVVLLAWVVAAIFAFIVFQFWYLGFFVRIPGILVAITLAHLLWVLRVLFERVKDEKEELEVRVSRETAPRLHQWVGSIARERDLPAPDEVRISADSVAHVYQRINGKNALVLGAVAVRTLPQPVLTEVVGQELGFLAGDDTDFPGQARRRHLVMQQVEQASHTDPDSRLLRNYTRDPRLRTQMLFMWAAVLNPAIGLIRLYHRLYLLAYAAYNRQCAYVADEHGDEQAGAEATARALILQMVAGRMTWTQLSSLAEKWVESKESAKVLFDEQSRKARALQPDHWQDALRKELKKAAGATDFLPSLKDRLAAIGISSKQALQLTPATAGPASTELFDGRLPEMEAKLTERLLSRFRKAQIAKAEASDAAEANRAMIMRGERPDW